MVESIGFVVNPHKPQAFGLACELIEQALSASRKVLVEKPAPCETAGQEVSLEELVQQSDIIFVLGGDGSMLRVARQAAPAGTPVLGVQFGNYGFIMETEPSEAPQVLQRVLEGDYQITTRLMLQTELIRQGRPTGSYLALNDIVVGRGNLSRLLRLNVEVGQHEVVRYSADGLIVATPTGSTAYSLSAGGPVVHPSLHVMLLTPIAPHTLNSRALVVSADEPVEVLPSGNPLNAALTVDGQLMQELEEGDVVRVNRAPFGASFVQTTPSAFYRQLDSRFGFGERLER